MPDSVTRPHDGDTAFTPGPPGPERDEIGALANRIELIRDQVDALQTSAAPAKLRWFQWAGSATSVVSLVVTISIAIWANRLQARKDVSAAAASGLDQLTKVTSDLVALRSEENTAFNTPGANPNAYATGSAIRNAKRQVLLDEADRLVQRLGSGVSPQILLTLASE